MEAASIREIARASGYSKGIVEHYFLNKNELVDAALAWANDRYYLRVVKATKDLRGLAALRARIRATLPTTRTTRIEWKIRLVFWSMAAIDPTVGRHQALRGQEAAKHFAADIEAAAELGEIGPGADTITLGRGVFHSVSGLSCALLHNRKAYTRNLLEQETENIVSTISMRTRSAC